MENRNHPQCKATRTLTLRSLLYLYCLGIWQGQVTSIRHFQAFQKKPKNHRAQNRKIQHAKLFPTTAGWDKVIPFPQDAVPMAQRRKHSHNDCVFQDIREVPRSEVTF